MANETKNKHVQFPWHRAENAADVYSNLTTLNWSLFDVRIRFGQVLPSDQEESPHGIIEERAAVTVSWPQAKILMNQLIDAINRYEKANGEIKPTNLIP